LRSGKSKFLAFLSYHYVMLRAVVAHAHCRFQIRPPKSSWKKSGLRLRRLPRADLAPLCFL
jgi:hypothetical protein